MKKLHVLILTALAAGFAPHAWAVQEAGVDQPAPAPTTTTIPTKPMRLVRVGGDLRGKALVNQQNETLGLVEDVVVHPRGYVAFIEFSAVGALETDVKRFPVPWRALERNEAGNLVLNATGADFAASPSYDKKLSARAMDWWDATEKAYAAPMAAKASPTEAASSLAPAKPPYLASDLRARTIEHPDGTKLATVQELVFDARDGRVAYVVLAAGGDVRAGPRFYAVPWEALKAMPDEKHPDVERLTLSTTREKLEKAPEFQTTTEGWQKANELDYTRTVYEHYAVPFDWATEKKVGE